MSAKYKRIRQTDESLPAPLRWLTRAFSSITLSVTLLCMVAAYGVLGSLPVYFMAIGAAWLVVVVVVMGTMIAGCVQISRDPKRSKRSKTVICLLGLAGAVGMTIGVCGAVYGWIDAMPVFLKHKATIIYRLPAIEMNETEFFGWWPLQLILLLFVVNLIWATIRRIEFSIPRLGVLTVHTGIVVTALGSVFYSQLKVEGDMFIVRSDLPGGRSVSFFYDRKMPAMFVSVDSTPAMQFALPELPRYNDYAAGELAIKLHEKPGFVDRFSKDLRITIPGFYAYAEFEQMWVESPPPPPESSPKSSPEVPSEVSSKSAPEVSPPRKVQTHGAGLGTSLQTYRKPSSLDPTKLPTVQQKPPAAGQKLPGTAALVVAMGDAEAPSDGPRFTMPADRPAERMIEDDRFAVEYLHAPSRQRLMDLMAQTPVNAKHALLVEVPSQNYRGVVAIEPGLSFDVGETGYAITVEEIGPYELPFVTEGYRGAADTHARLSITRPGPSKPIQRYALHRYPERSQDFVEGQRGDPALDIRTVYLDQSKIQVHLITAPPPTASAGEVPAIESANAHAEGLWVLLRVAGIKPIFSPLTEGKMPLVNPSRANAWMHVVDRLEHAVEVQQPRITAKALRDPKIEGTYEKAIVQVRVEVDLRDEDFKLTGETFSQTVMLRQMPYLEQRGGEMQPATVVVPGYGTVEIAFGRRRQNLPFAVAMTDFEMTPYPGSTIPRDFQSDLLIYRVDEDGLAAGAPDRFSPRLNNPATVYSPHTSLQLRRIKLSQAGWDPGDPNTSAAMKKRRDDNGRLINQQRFTILGVGNNVGIRVIALGGILVAIGIPWAFYVKPWMIKRKAKKFNASLKARQAATSEPLAAKHG